MKILSSAILRVGLFQTSGIMTTGIFQTGARSHIQAFDKTVGILKKKIDDINSGNYLLPLDVNDCVN